MRTLKRLVCLCLCAVVGAVILDAQESKPTPKVTIVGIPPAGEGGPGRTEPISGTAVGPDIRDLRVVIYAYAGTQWWVQPTAASPMTPIDASSGKWDTDTHLGRTVRSATRSQGLQTTGDGGRAASDRWGCTRERHRSWQALTTMRWPVLAFTVFSALPLLSGMQWRHGPQSKRITFSGWEFIVKDSGGVRVGPGSNYFDQDAVTVDARGLTLRVLERDGRFYCAEVVATANLGYGLYRFTVGSNVDRLAPNLTLGLFTWSDEPGEEGTHKELDVELGRWGNRDNDVAQYVVPALDQRTEYSQISDARRLAGVHPFIQLAARPSAFQDGSG